jgi:hypothetical protein
MIGDPIVPGWRRRLLLPGIRIELILSLPNRPSPHFRAMPLAAPVHLNSTPSNSSGLATRFPGILLDIAQLLGLRSRQRIT